MDLRSMKAPFMVLAEVFAGRGRQRVEGAARPA